MKLTLHGTSFFWGPSQISNLSSSWLPWHPERWGSCSLFCGLQSCWTLTQTSLAHVLKCFLSCANTLLTNADVITSRLLWSPHSPFSCLITLARISRVLWVTLADNVACVCLQNFLLFFFSKLHARIWIDSIYPGTEIFILYWGLKKINERIVGFASSLQILSVEMTLWLVSPLELTSFKLCYLVITFPNS